MTGGTVGSVAHAAVDALPRDAPYDAFGERLSRHLWVGDADVVEYPTVRKEKLERRALQAAKSDPCTGAKDWWGNEVLLLTYNRATYDEVRRRVSL